MLLLSQFFFNFFRSTPASPSSRSDAEDDDMSLLDFLRTGKPMDEEEVRKRLFLRFSE